MSINHIIGQNGLSTAKIGQKPQKAQDPGKNETSFMDVLRDKFDEVTSQMKGVPGMPGIYSFNTPEINPISPNNTNVSFII